MVEIVRDDADGQLSSRESAVEGAADDLVTNNMTPGDQLVLSDQDLQAIYPGQNLEVVKKRLSQQHKLTKGHLNM